MALWFWLLAVLSAPLALWSWLWTTRRHTNAPGPPTLPLLGNALHFRKLPTVVEHLRSLQRRYGDVFRFYVGPKLFVVVTRAEDVQKVLTASHRRDPYLTRPLKTLLGDGLVSNYGNKWKAHRRATEPTFRREVVGTFVDIFNAAAEVVCRRLSRSAGSELDVHTLLFEAALRSLTASSFALSLDEVLPDSLTTEELAEMMVFGLQFTQSRLYRPWLLPDWTLFLVEDGRKFSRKAKVFHDIIKRTFEALSKKPLDNEHNKVILADVLLGRKGENKFSAQEMFDEACTFALAGSDTTAATLSYVLSLLALNPEWQERAVRELGDVYSQGGDYLRTSTMDDLDQLVVLESIVKETLRLFPTVPIGPYVSRQDIPLTGGRYVAPRGTCFLVAYSLLHRQPDAFPDPDKFDPLRFLEAGSSSGNHPYSYLPFGGGPRKCPGYRYAMVQVKTVLSAVLRRFRFLPGSTREELEEVVLAATAHPRGGYRVTCLPRSS